MRAAHDPLNSAGYLRKHEAKTAVVRAKLGAALRDPAALIVVVAGLGLFLCGLREIGQWFFPYRWWFVAGLAFGLLGMAARASSIPYRSEHYCLYAVMVISTISCIISPMPAYSFARLATFIVMFVAVFIGCWLWLQNKANQWLLVSLFVASAVIGSLASLYFLLEQESLIPSARVTGAFGKATGTGSFAAGVLPLVLWKWQYGRGRWRLFYLGILGILCYILIFSGARAAMGGGAFAAGIWFWKHRPVWRPLLFGGGVLGLALLLTGVVNLDELPGYIVRKETIPTFTGRIPRWKVGIDLFLQSPILGHGYGMTRYVRLYEEGGQPRGQIVPGNFSLVDLLPGGESVRVGRMTLHSDQVERLVETGLLGFIPFALFWYFLLRRVVVAFRWTCDIERSLAMAIGLNVFYLFINSFMHGALFAINAPSTLLAWLGIALFMAVSDQGQNRQGTIRLR